METGRFKIAWWNTRLTPPKGNKLEGAERTLAFNVIDQLLAAADIIGLCEVDDDDIGEIAKAAGDAFVVRRFAVSDVGKKFHMCLIVRSGQVAVHAASAYTRSEARRTFRIGVWASCVVQDLSFDLYLVHWPSRMFAKQEGFDRNFFGYALRDDIDLKIKAGRTNFIVVGDFNDEPYNGSMNERLLATRDPAIARKSPDFLYNPFWKRMAPAVGYVRGSQDHEPFGSFYYSGNALVKWHSLDQLLVSGTFLGPMAWHLDEEKTDVWRLPELFSHVSKPKNLIDHLPVIGEFARY